MQTATHAAPPTPVVTPVLATPVGIPAVFIGIAAVGVEPVPNRPGYRARHAEAVR